MKQAYIYYIGFIILMFTQTLFAQQVWNGKLTGDTRWAGEILIDGDIIVPRKVSLTIEPGTVIKIKPNSDVTNGGKDKSKIEIYVFGSLIANGTPENKITFTSASSDPRMADWYGIILKNKKGTNLLNQVIIEYAYSGISTINCSAVIKNSIFRYNYHAAISAELRSTPIIQNCIITGNDYAGIKCEFGAKPEIKNTMITENSHGVIIFQEAEPILGKIEQNGELIGGANRIFGNFDYNIYNHTYKTIYAQANSWTLNSEKEIKNTIYDKSKDPQYGEVILSPTLEQYERRTTVAAARSQSARRSEASQAATQGTTQGATPGGQRAAATGNTAQQKPGSTVPAQEKPTVGEKTTVQVPAEQPTEKVIAENKTDKNTSEQKLPETTSQNVSDKTEQPTEVAVAKTPVKTEEKEEEAPKENPDDQYWSLKKPIFQGLLDNVPKRTKTVPIKFPSNAPSISEPVRVYLNLIIGVDGKVESAQLLRVRGAEVFGEAALEAVRQFEYTPGKYKGRPVRYMKTELIRFAPN
ncbi:MAG: hypothetical protein Kow00108_08610 [Calditrichia bacterium]